MAIAEWTRESRTIGPNSSHISKEGRPASSTQYLDQSARSLCWTLIEGELDVRHFQLLASATLRAPGFCFRAHIVGASHLMRMEWGTGELYHEVVACGGLPELAKPISSARLASRPRDTNALAILAGGRRLRFESQIVDAAIAAPRLSRLRDEIERAGSNPRRVLGLQFEFPSPEGEGRSDLTNSSVRPTTLVWAALSAADQRLEIETAHSYPNEGRVVFTRTGIDTRRAGGVAS